MAALKLTGFNGIYPRTAERLLNDQAAQMAENVNLTSGEIRPIRYPELAFAATAPLTAYRATDATTEKWRTWPIDVDVAKGALAADVEGRYYWTGDGEPRFATYTNFGSTDFALGIPTPTTAVSVSHSGGTGTASTRFYRYTFVSQNGEESGPSPVSTEVTGKIDGTWNIGGVTAMQAVPLNGGVVSSTTRSGSTITAVVSAYCWLRVGDVVVVAGVGTMTEANGTVTVTAVATNGLSFSYVVTAAATGTPGGSGTWARQANWNTSGMYRKLYRTTGTAGSWQLVSEYVSTDPLYASWTSATTFSDTHLDSAIAGDDLITDGWEPPPAGLLGIGVLPSGAAYGFVNGLLCFSEPSQYHAWPTIYQLASDYPIVQVESYGTVVVVGTQGTPYMADGVEPASATMQKVNQLWPCLSKRSMVSVGDAVVYASSFGLVMIGAQGASVFTQPFFTEAEWKPYTPSSMVCGLSEGRLFVRYESTGESPAILLFKMQEPAPLTTSSVQCGGLYVDPNNGEMYVLQTDGVYKFDADAGLRIPYTWTSKEIEVPTPVNFGAARVEFKRVLSAADEAAAVISAAAIRAANIVTLAAYTNTGAVNGRQVNGGGVNLGPNLTDVPTTDAEYVSFTLVSDGDVVFTKTLTQPQSFRLPAGYLTDNFSVKLSGTVRVLSVKMAETMSGLGAI